MATKTTLMTAISLMGIDDPVPMFIASSDVNANSGAGAFTLTNDQKLALHFDTMEDALECWRKQSRVKPLRNDGMPNRPLTALTVSFQNIQIEDEGEKPA